MKSQSQLYSRYFTYIKPVIKIPIIKTYGSTIFTLVIITIFMIFAIKPTVETILVLQKKLEDSNSTLEKVNKKATNLSLGKENYDNLDENIKNKISNAIPNNTSLKTLIQTLEQIAVTHDASISALQVEPFIIEVANEVQPGTPANISYTFNIEGSYEKLLAILKDLQTSSRLISIESLSLSQLNEGEGLIMSTTGKTYYLK